MHSENIYIHNSSECVGENVGSCEPRSLCLAVARKERQRAVHVYDDGPRIGSKHVELISI